MDTPTESFEYQKNGRIPNKTLDNKVIEIRYMQQRVQNRSEKYIEHLWKVFKATGLETELLYKLRALMVKTGDKRVKTIDRAIKEHTNASILKASVAALKIL
jgi:hypothetical protein